MAQSSMITASCTVTVALLISYGYLYLSERKPYLLTWILSLSLLLSAYLSRIIMIETGYEHSIFRITNFTCTMVGYWLILKGTDLFFSKKLSKIWLNMAVLLIVLYTIHVLLAWPADGVLLFAVMYTSVLLIKSGLTCLKASSPKSTVRVSLGYTYFIWAGVLLLYPLSHIYGLISSSISYLLIGVVGLIAFITIQAMYFLSIKEELELKEANIRELVAYDKLTGAYSRPYFEQTSTVFMKELSLPAVLVMADFNGLKLINDTFGHEKGDELLVDGVRVIQDAVGKDSKVVRWGGDEFIIIIPRITMQEAELTIKTIKTKLKTFCPKTIPLDISFGMSLINGKNQGIEVSIKRAEDVMYSNKLSESRKTRLAIVNFLEKLLLEKDYQTEEHVMRLKNLTHQMGEAIGLSSRELVNLTQVAMLHDIGKIGVPVEILNKQGPLTEHEWSLMKKHSEIGYRITQASGELAHISEAILAHHEWWDGSGYPQGLKGEEIPLYSRIVSIVDSYDVMTNDRPYKKTMNTTQALAEINQCAGTQFDPYLVDVFNRVMKKNKITSA